MAGVVLQLDVGARRLASGDGDTAAAAHLLSSLGSQARQALTQTRQSVAAMRASPNPEPLHEQLAAVAERAFAGTEVVVHLTQTGTVRPYPPTAETEIVGIAGEAMTNARRHSGCRTVWVACAYEPGELRLAVRDDGHGFDPSQATPVGHWGLVGMRERAVGDRRHAHRHQRAGRRHRGGSRPSRALRLAGAVEAARPARRA